MSCIGAAKRCQRGQSVVEIALIMPLVLMLILGTLDLGRAVYAHTALAHAVREGARAAVVQNNTNSVVIQKVVQAAVGTNLTAGGVTIGGARTSGSTVIVSASVNFALVTPFIRGIVGNSIVLRAQASMIVD